MSTIYKVCKAGATVCTCDSLEACDRYINSRPPHARERYSIKGVRRG